MRQQRFLSAVLMALFIVALGVGLVANKPQPLVNLTWTGGGESHPQVDEQSWWINGGTVDPNHTIVNHTPCTWDINDNSDFQLGPGGLDPGVVWSTTGCHIADIAPIFFCQAGQCFDNTPSNFNWHGLSVRAPDSSIIGSICFQPQNRCFTATPAFDSRARQYVSMLCVTMLYAASDSAVITIPGSQALDGAWGRGVPTTVTRTVTNTGVRSVKAITAAWGLSSDIFTTPGCPLWGPNTGVWQVSYPRTTDYPFMRMTN